MKLNMILGKKQIILASLVLVLGVAIYLNYTFSESGNGYDITASVNSETTDDRTYGEAQLTSAEPDEYFTAARVERKKARDESVETLATTLKDSSLSDEEKEVATNKALEVSQQIESENKIETLVKAKGFQECLAFVDEDSVKVVVQTEGLDAEQAAQIKNIIVEETNMPAENIVVDEVQ